MDNMEVDINEEEFIAPTYANKLNAEAYEDDNSNDLTLVAGIDQKDIRCNRLIVSEASPYFNSLLLGTMREAYQNSITFPHVDSDVLHALIRFCYVGRIHITDDNVMDLLAGASSMELVVVENFCAEYIVKHMSTDNFRTFWIEGERYSLDALKTRALSIAVDYFPKIRKSNDFLNLKVKYVRQILTNSYLSAYCEDDVFKALVVWIRHEESDRKKFFIDLMRFVHVRDMSTKYLSLDGELNKCCIAWATREYFEKLIWYGQTSPVHPLAECAQRYSLNQLVPMFFGTDTNKSQDMFTVEKVSLLQQDLVEIIRFDGYRSGHSVVQAKHFVYIIGGKDAMGNPMNTVQRINLRNWSVETKSPMIQKRSHFEVIYHCESIYAIGGNFDTPESPDVILSVESYNIVKDQWEYVASLELYGHIPYQLYSIVEGGTIHVFYTGGSSVFFTASGFWSNNETEYIRRDYKIREVIDLLALTNSDHYSELRKTRFKYIMYGLYRRFDKSGTTKYFKASLHKYLECIVGVLLDKRVLECHFPKRNDGLNPPYTFGFYTTRTFSDDEIQYFDKNCILVQPNYFKYYDS